MMAGLSHFSMSALGIVSCVLLTISISNGDKIIRHQQAKRMLLGLIVSKIFLIAWYFAFEYRIESRLSIVLTNGTQFFLDRYGKNPIAFWLTPGFAFLITYIFIVTYFLFTRQIKFALTLLFSILLAYVGLFFTTDGLRVFAVIIVGPYLIGLRQVITKVHPQIYHLSLNLVSHIAKFFDPNPRQLTLSAACAGFWLLVIFKAKSRGLLLNESTNVRIFNNDINFLDIYIWLTGSMILTALAIPCFRRVTAYVSLVKQLITLTFTVLLFQILRRYLFPSEEFTVNFKVAGVITLIGIMLISHKFTFLPFIHRRKPLFDQVKRLLLS